MESLVYFKTLFLAITFGLISSTVQSIQDKKEFPICREPNDDIYYEYVDISYGDWYKLQKGLYNIIIDYIDSTGYDKNYFICRNGPTKVSSLPYIFNQVIVEDINHRIDTLKWNTVSDTICNHNFTFKDNNKFLNGFIITTCTDTIYATKYGFPDLHRGWPEGFPEEKIIFDRMKTSVSPKILNDMRKPLREMKYPESIYNYFSRIIIKDGKVEDIQTLYSRDLKYQNVDEIWDESTK